jgi:hypothetical protein
VCNMALRSLGAAQVRGEPDAGAASRAANVNIRDPYSVQSDRRLRPFGSRAGDQHGRVQIAVYEGPGRVVAAVDVGGSAGPR